VIDFVAYCRVSTHSARDRLAVQESEIRAFVGSVDGSLGRVFAEVGKGDSSDLRQRDQAIELLRNSSLVLLVTEIDRFTRYPHFIDQFEQEFGDRIVTVRYPEDDHATRRIRVCSALEWINEHDEDQDEWDAIAARKGWPTGGAAIRGVHCPSSYKLEHRAV
jgi:DNA invertase Pin-like site-specific DNA recombinase